MPQCHNAPMQVPAGTSRAVKHRQRLEILTDPLGTEVTLGGCGYHYWLPNGFTPQMLRNAVEVLLGEQGEVQVFENVGDSSAQEKVFEIEFQDGGLAELIQVRSRGISWSATHIKVGGVDFLPIPGSMLLSKA